MRKEGPLGRQTSLVQRIPPPSLRLKLEGKERRTRRTGREKGGRGRLCPYRVGGETKDVEWGVEHIQRSSRNQKGQWERGGGWGKGSESRVVTGGWED